MHGAKDPLVPLRQAEILAEELKEADVPVQLHVIPDAGHGLMRAETIEMTRRFFDRTLTARRQAASDAK